MSKKNAPLSRKEEEEKNASENNSPQLMPMKKGSMFAKFDDLAGLKRKAFASMYKKKSTVSQPGDPSEVQADAVAKAVVEGNATAAQAELQNNVSGEEITAKATDVSFEIPPGFEEQLEKMKGGGIPLPDDKKELLEDMLGTDLSDVRLHTGSDAKDLAEEINALAFATGNDIFYPGNLDDDELLAHEVAHTIQENNEAAAKSIHKKEPLYGQRPKTMEWEKQYFMDLDGDGDGFAEIQLWYKTDEKGHVEVQLHHLDTGQWPGYKSFAKYIIPYPNSAILFNKYDADYKQNNPMGPDITGSVGVFKAKVRIYNADDPNDKQLYELVIFADTDKNKSGTYYVILGDQQLAFHFDESRFKYRTPLPEVWTAYADDLTPRLNVNMGVHFDDILLQFLPHTTEFVDEKGKPLPLIKGNRTIYAQLAVYMQLGGTLVHDNPDFPLYLSGYYFMLEPEVVDRDANEVSIRLIGDDQNSYGSYETDFTLFYHVMPLNVNEKGESTDLATNRHVILTFTGPAIPGNKHTKSFTVRDGKLAYNSFFRGEADFQKLKELYSPELLGNMQLPVSVAQEIGTAKGAVEALIGMLVEKKEMGPRILSTWKEYDFAISQLEMVHYSDSFNDKLTILSMKKSCGILANAFFSALQSETSGDWIDSVVEGDEIVSDVNYSYNPYTGESTHAASPDIIPPGNDIEKQSLSEVFEHHKKMRETLEQLAQDRAATSADPETKKIKDSIEQWKNMQQGLKELEGKKHLQKIKAVFYGDKQLNDFNNGTGVRQLAIPLSLWAYVEDKGEGENWHIKDFYNPNLPFIGKTVPFTSAHINGEGKAIPPRELFQGLNDELHLPAGEIYYEIEGRVTSIKTTGESTDWWDIAGWIGLALAAIAVGLLTFGTGTVAVIGTALMYTSAALSIAATAGELYHSHETGQLTNKQLFMGVLEIFTSLVQIKLMSLGRVVNNSSKAVKIAGAVGQTSRLYMPLKIAEIGGQATQVLVMTYDYAQQIKAIMSAPANDEEKQRALIILFSQALVTTGLSIIDLKGSVNDVKGVNGAMDLEIVDEVQRGKVYTYARPKVRLPGDDVVLTNIPSEFSGQNMDTRTLLDYILGKQRMKSLDDQLHTNKSKADELFDDFSTEQVYHTMNLADGNLQVTEKNLREMSFGDWINNLDKEKVVKKFDKNKKLKQTYLEMDPKVRRTCTFCESPCDIIDGITPQQTVRLETILDTMTEYSPEWIKLKRILSKTRNNDANKSNQLLEDELMALEQAMLPNGGGLNQYIENRFKHVVSDSLGISKRTLDSMSPEAQEGLLTMSEDELNKIANKSASQIEFAGVKKYEVNTGIRDRKAGEYQKSKHIDDIDEFLAYYFDDVTISAGSDVNTQISRPNIKLTNGNVSEGLEHILRRHHPDYFQNNLGGKGDLFPKNTTIEQIINGITEVYQGTRVSNPNKIMQTFEKRIKLNGESANYRLSVDTQKGIIISFFKIGQ